MSNSLMIRYKQPDIPPFIVPFSFENVLVNCWEPLGRQLGLKWIEWLDHSVMRTSDDVQHVIAELHQAIEYLKQPEQVDYCHGKRQYMVDRATQAITYLEDALARWHEIESISL